MSSRASLGDSNRENETNDVRPVASTAIGSPKDNTRGPSRTAEAMSNLKQEESTIGGLQNGAHGASPEVATHSEDREDGRSDRVAHEIEPLKGFRLYSLAGAMVFVVCLVMLNAQVVATAVPSITNYFGSIADVGWYASAYNLANCTLQPLAGRIFTHQSLKYSYIAFIAVFELGNLICGLAVSSKMLIVGRAIAGAGQSGIINGSLSIIAHVAPIEKRPVFVSLIANVARIGAVFGPLLGGALSEDVSWRWAFLINCPVGAVAALVIFLVQMPERADKDNLRNNWKAFLQSLDLRGFGLFAPATIMFLLALQWGGVVYPWNSATIIGLFCGSAAMLGLFMAWEVHNGDKALIPLSMLRIRTVWSGFFLQNLQFGCLFLLSYYLPIWFQVVKQASPINSGLMTLPSILSQMFAGLAAAFAVQRIGYYTPFAIASCIGTAIGAGLMTTFQPWTGPNLWIGYQILMGSGRGLAGQMSYLAVQYALPKAQVSLGTALLSFGGNLGAAIFIAAGQTLFANLLYPALREFAPGVDPDAIINAGSTDISTGGNSTVQYEIILSYNQALTKMFWLGSAASATGIIFCFGLGWGNIKKKKDLDKAEKQKTEEHNNAPREGGGIQKEEV